MIYNISPKLLESLGAKSGLICVVQFNICIGHFKVVDSVKLNGGNVLCINIFYEYHLSITTLEMLALAKRAFK